MIGAKAFAALISLAVMGSALAAPAHAQFGDLGGIVDKVKKVGKVGNAVRPIGEAEEIKIGADLAGIILGAAPLSTNTAQQHYVNRLGMWLAQHSERPNLPWKFAIIESSDFNAFSTPGGYVLISRGLFESMRTEAELAGVLAHEIAHVVRKHHLQAIQNKLRTELATEMGADYAAKHAGAAGALTSQIIASGKEMFIKGLDQGDELEADRMGVVIAARSGYSPYGLVAVLQTLSTTSEKDSSVALMFNTHPSPGVRIEKLDEVMGTRLDGVPGLVDDLPSFAQLRNPAPAPQPAAVAQAEAPQPKATRKKK